MITCIIMILYYTLNNVYLGFPGGSEVKASACSAGDPARSLGREDPLEKEMTTHSSILAWRIPWMEEPGKIPWKIPWMGSHGLAGYSPWSRKESDTTERLHFHFIFINDEWSYPLSQQSSFKEFILKWHSLRTQRFRYEGIHHKIAFDIKTKLEWTKILRDEIQKCCCGFTVKFLADILITWIWNDLK